MIVTQDTHWRHLGAVPYEAWRKRITDAGGVSDVAERDVWEVFGDDSALALAMLRMESSYASHFAAIPASKHNPWNLQIMGVGLSFNTIKEGAEAWRKRLYDPLYKQGIYAKTVTIADLIETYAPRSDGNDTDTYIRTVVDLINANGLAPIVTKPSDTPVTVPSTPPEPVAESEKPTMPATLDYSKLSFPVEVRLIPPGQTLQRPGIKMKPLKTTWHDTDNRNFGAGADMHARWMADGCRDNYGNPTYTSWHFTVDDKKAIQHIPLDEVAWHAGDGNGPGNMTSIAIEECVNYDRDASKTRANAAELHAFLIRELGLPGGVDACVQHNVWSGKNCPATIRNAGLWPSVRKLITDRLGSTPAKPVYADAAPIPKGSRIVNGHVFLAPGGKTVQADVVPTKWADTDQPPTGPAIKKGTKIAQEQIAHYVQGTDGNLWVELISVPGVKDGSRIPAAALIGDTP